MDITTIVEFREALLNPELRFATLKNVVADIDSLSRTHHFAECRATIAGRSALIYAPISPRALSLARNAAEVLATVQSRTFTPFEILDAEILCGNDLKRRCTIVVEYPLRGQSFSQAQYTLSDVTLMQGLRRLENELKLCNISHNNLHSDNIIIDNTSTWHCIRQYYTTTGLGGDSVALENLREIIVRHSISSSTLNEPMSAYSISPMHENRVQIEESGLIGFADEAGRKIVECKYLWASDFAEQRAMVTTPERRMGLIDSLGREIIPPIYDELIYDVKTGRSQVVLNGRCAEFDYNGNQISDWAEE